jgi:hypothetical protein
VRFKMILIMAFIINYLKATNYLSKNQMCGNSNNSTQ